MKAQQSQVDKTPDEDIKVTNKLEPVTDSKRAAALFATILRAVREQAQEEKNNAWRTTDE